MWYHRCHSFDMTAANVPDILYLKDVRWKYHDCMILADKGYLVRPYKRTSLRQPPITLEVPYRLNQKIGNRLHGHIGVSERELRQSSRS